MQFYGITLHGPQNFIRDMLRDEYEEPIKKENVRTLMDKVENYSTMPKKIQRPDINTIRVIDVYIGRVNGFAYGSFQRLNKMKRKGALHPTGPSDMYRLPPLTSTEYGWWQHDPLLEKVSWHHTYPKYPQPSSPNSLVLDAVRKNNKYATLF